MWGKILDAAFLLSIAAACAVSARARAQEPCPDLPVQVSASTPEVRALVCRGARDAIALLRKCEIHVQRPVAVSIRDEVRHPLGQVVIGLFEPARERILIAAYERMAALVEDTPYRVIPLEDFFRSVVVHEIVHAVLNQHYRQRPHNVAVYEYPAYALQIASLPPTARALFLEHVGARGDTHEPRFNDLMLAFDPYLFAARAYHHFSASRTGCAHVTTLLGGKAEFIADLQ